MIGREKKKKKTFNDALPRDLNHKRMKEEERERVKFILISNLNRRDDAM